jgi:hypothetical protein
MGIAQVRPEYAHLYPALARGQWYPVLQTDEQGRALRVRVGPDLVEVAAEHVARRREAEAREAEAREAEAR